MITLQQKIEKLQNKIKDIRANRNNKSRVVGSILKLIRLEKELESQKEALKTSPKITLSPNRTKIQARKKRTDVHRESMIIPSDYEFVGIRVGHFFRDDVWLYDQQQKIKAHINKTGGSYFSDSICNCDICGALHTESAVYYHKKLNEYIKVGETCSEKLSTGSESDFRRAKREQEIVNREAKRKQEIADRKAAYKASVKKANHLLIEAGLPQVIEIFNLVEEFEHTPRKEGENPKKIGTYHSSDYFNLNKIKSIVETIVKTGRISERQLSYINHLLEEINAPKTTEELSAVPSEGAVKITGIIQSTEIEVNSFKYNLTETCKMTVLDDRGFNVYVSIPSNICDNPESLESLELEGKRIEFTATLTKSDTFGEAIGKRPRKAKLL